MKLSNLFSAVLVTACVTAGVGISVAKAEPTGEDYYWNVPVGSTFVVTQKLNIRPNDTRAYVAAEGVLSPSSARSKVFSRTQLCYLEARESTQFDRVVAPGTALKIRSIILNEWEMNGDLIFGFEVDSPNIKAIMCNINGLVGQDARNMKIEFFTYTLSPAMELKLLAPTEIR